MFNKKTIKDIDLANKQVLVRCEFDVPLTEFGTVANDYRIKTSLPTLRYLLEQNCRIVIIAHLGRPKGQVNPKYSLAPVASCLAALIGQEVKFVDDCIGQKVNDITKNLAPRSIVLLENTRFYPEEEANDSNFAQNLVLDSNTEVFVSESFGVAHRAHASIVGVTKFLPSVAGLLLAEEVETITKAMSEPDRPLMAIVGGAKISDKIVILQKFIELADCVAVIGAMANTFLLAKGAAVGKSLVEPDALELASQIMSKKID
jgi:phosphoglycerate kinase